VKGALIMTEEGNEAAEEMKRGAGSGLRVGEKRERRRKRVKH